MAIDVVAMGEVRTEQQRHSLKSMQTETGESPQADASIKHHNQATGSIWREETLPVEGNEEKNGQMPDEKPRTNEAVDDGETNGEQEEEEEEEVESENEEDVEEADCKTESYVDHGDNEAEYHDTAVSVIGSGMPQEIMIEASRTALFRRYSKMTPSVIEEQERRLHEDERSKGLSNESSCPEPSFHICENPVCIEQLRWRDARITDLQAALDHMAEAMAIQQRDMASQRIFLSRQAEQLTNLSIKLRQEKVALHVEKERFHRSKPTAGPLSLKLNSDKLKSPVKKILSVATGRRASADNADRMIDKPLNDAGSAPELSSSRSGSSSQLRQNPLCIDTPRAPIAERSSSLSSLELQAASTKMIIAITPPKIDMSRSTLPHLDASLVEVVLNDPHAVTPTSASQSTVSIHSPSFKLQDIDQLQRSDRGDSTACSTPDQKKLSLGDRFRSIRWGRT